MEENKKSKTGIAVLITVIICLVVTGLVGYGCYSLGVSKGRSQSAAKSILNGAKGIIDKALEEQDKWKDKLEEGVTQFEENLNNSVNVSAGVIKDTTNGSVIVYYKTDDNDKTTRYIISNQEAVSKVNELLKTKTKTNCENDDDCSGVGVGAEVYIITDGSNAETIYHADSLSIVYDNVFYDLKGNKTIVDILNEYIK